MQEYRIWKLMAPLESFGLLMEQKIVYQSQEKLKIIIFLQNKLLILIVFELFETMDILYTPLKKPWNHEQQKVLQARHHLIYSEIPLQVLTLYFVLMGKH